MIICVGLGNPGGKYAGNRHNIGFMAVDAIADTANLGPEKVKFQGVMREGTIETPSGRQKLICLKPATFMNESGRSVQAALSFYKLKLSQIVVFHDELDLEPGKFRIKIGGGIAGHNGLRSIRQHCGEDFARARIGIGHPGHKDRVHSYVLSDFAKSEDPWVDDLNNAIARHAGLLCVDPLGLDDLNRFSTKVTLDAPAPSKTKK